MKDSGITLANNGLNTVQMRVRNPELSEDYGPLLSIGRPYTNSRKLGARPSAREGPQPIIERHYLSIVRKCRGPHIYWSRLL